MKQQLYILILIAAFGNGAIISAAEKATMPGSSAISLTEAERKEQADKIAADWAKNEHENSTALKKLGYRAPTRAEFAAETKAQKEKVDQQGPMFLISTSFGASSGASTLALVQQSSRSRHIDL